MIIPSIDLMGGKAVQLQQGKTKKLEVEDVLGLAREFRKYGDIAVIDLDAAMGKGNNTSLVKEICTLADCRVGGGIRTVEKASEMLRAGAKKIIIGTKATPDFLRQLPREQGIVAVDTKDKKRGTEGWTKTTAKTPLNEIKELESYCSEFLFTNVEREGMMRGIDIKVVEAVVKATRNKVTVAGGVTTMADIRKIDCLGANAQLGMTIYTGKINLADSFAGLLDFSKNKGLIPTIAQDGDGQMLMLAFSTKESLLRTFQTGEATYYSRSRGKIWTKGETSGNAQQLITVRYDCDKDTLLFRVRQKNAACHLGMYSCFGEKEFVLEDLYRTIKDRIRNPSKESYTSRIAADEKLVKTKIKEECNEVLKYKNKDNLLWEIADLTYFVLMHMAKNNITIADIRNELRGRRK